MKTIFFNSRYSLTWRGFFMNSCTESLKAFLVDFDTEGPAGEIMRLRAAAKLVMEEKEVVELYVGPWDKDSRYGPKVAEQMCLLFDGFEAMEKQDSDRWFRTFTDRGVREDLFGELVQKLNLHDLTPEPINKAFDQLYPLEQIKQNADAGNALFLSTDAKLAHVYARTYGKVTPENTLAILAMSGIQIALPRIYCRPADVLLDIKMKFAAEREEYVTYLRQSLSDCHDAIVAGNYKDAWEFASWKMNQDLLAKLQKFEGAVKKGDKQLLKKIAVGLGDEAPSLFQSVLTGNVLGVGGTLLKTLYEAIKGGTALGQAEQEFPMVGYIYRLKKIQEKMPSRKARATLTAENAKSAEST